MAETNVLFVLQQSLPYVVNEGILLQGVDRDFKEIKEDFENIQSYINDADRKAADDEGGSNKGAKTWTKQLREVSFRIEDVIDYNKMCVAQGINFNHSRFISFLHKIVFMIPTLISRHQFASEIHDIKLSVGRIKKRSATFDFEQGSSSRGTKAARFFDPQMAFHFFEETDVVGFESPRDELVKFLVGENNNLMLFSVVGMGGLGKTTLAKLVFDSQEVKNHFVFRFFISASQLYTVRDLLIDMIKKFSKHSNESIPKSLEEMDDNTLTTFVRQYLEPKQYLMWFDDVRKEDFSDGIEHAMTNNKRGSRIIVTTRRMNVAEFFKKSFPVIIHKLQPLPQSKALELFRKRAFRYEPAGQCPAELEKMSEEIVQKCGGLPLAILATGGFFSTKAKIMSEWREVSQNMIMGLERNAHFTNLTMILSQSYDELPCHLKLCMLYFGIYPEHSTINCKRLTRQWIAEGFVKFEDRRTLEEVAEDYLKELIHTCLVQVSSVGFNGKIKSCQVHDLLHHIIIKKMKDLSFCHIMYEDHEQVTVGITRRFSIAACSHDVLSSNSNSGIRAIFVFDKGKLLEYFIDSLSDKFKLVKVLDFEHSLLNYVPKNLGNLFHLKYLNLSHTKVVDLPRSIGNLINLETLDLRQTQIHKLPKEINKLTKLRLLQVYYKQCEGHNSMLNYTTGARMPEGIGCLKSLRNLYYMEADCGGIYLIQELKELRQLRKLGIRCVLSEYGNALCAAIQEMNHLESLNIFAIDEKEILELDIALAPPYLTVLNLKARLTKLPEWIPKLQYLVKLMLGFSNFEDDPLDSLKNLTSLLRLHLWDDAFVGESLHFQIGGFLKLKELDLSRLNSLISISIDEKALLSLEHFRFNNNPKLKVVPRDLQHLKKLKFLEFVDMPDELVDSIEIGGRFHHIINHIPRVLIRQKAGSRFHDYELRPIPTQINV